MTGVGGCRAARVANIARPCSSVARPGLRAQGCGQRDGMADGRPDDDHGGVGQGAARRQDRIAMTSDLARLTSPWAGLWARASRVLSVNPDIQVWNS